MPLCRSALPRIPLTPTALPIQGEWAVERRQRPFVGWPVTGYIRPLGRLRLPQTALVHDRAMLDCLKQNRRRTLMKTSMRFDLVDLRLFLLVIEAASITHGAARAGMALASASARTR